MSAPVPAIAITRFDGEYRFLSNFYPAKVTYDGVTYKTVEHAYQAAKTLDPAERLHIQVAALPGDAKRIGRTVTLRPGWDTLRLEVMRALLVQKFAHPHLRAKLLATAPLPLIEGNTWGDVFWGMCRGEGENHLGRLLMEIREKSRA